MSTASGCIEIDAAKIIGIACRIRLHGGKTRAKAIFIQGVPEIAEEKSRFISRHNTRASF